MTKTVCLLRSAPVTRAPDECRRLNDSTQLALAVAAVSALMMIVLAHGGRGWWYDAAGFMALANPTVWIELSGLPPKRLPEYYARYDLGRLARRWIFGTDWPGVPGAAANARAVVDLGLDEETAGLVLGGNALAVYAGLEHLRDDRRPTEPARLKEQPDGTHPSE